MTRSMVSQVLEASYLRKIHVQHYAIVKVAFADLCKGLDLPSRLASELTKHYTSLLNPFLLRNAVAYFRVSEIEETSIELARQWFLQTCVDAWRWTGLGDVGFGPMREKCLQTRQPLPLSQYPQCRLLSETSEAYLRGYDDEQFSESQDAHVMASALERAMSLCQRDREIFSDIERDVQYFVPIRSQGRQTHNSHTSRDLPGVIFLSHHDDPWRLAEAIVHEHGHLQLDFLMSRDPIVIDEGRTFYSPWRDDPRPVHGLLHAIYVFTEVARFFIGRLNDADVDKAWIMQRLGLIAGRLCIAIAQVSTCEFTTFGSSIYLDIESSVREIAAGGYLSKQCCVELRRHYELWCRRNGVSEDDVCISALAGLGVQRA